MTKIETFMIGIAAGLFITAGLLWSTPEPKPIVKYIYDDEARLVGFCNGKYLIREEEDEFPEAKAGGTGCMFIEPITWKD